MYQQLIRSHPITLFQIRHHFAREAIFFSQIGCRLVGIPVVNDWVVSER